MEHENLFTVLGKWWDSRHQQRQEAQATTGSQTQHWRPNLANALFSILLTGIVVTGILWAQSAGALTLGASSSQTSSTIAYQGRLANTGGTPLTGTYNMIFRLYSAASGGTPLWEEQWTGSNSVQVSDGLFSVMLGSLTAVPQTIISGGSSLFLGITVGTDSEMSPRVQLGSVPYAIQALTVPDGSITSTKLAAGAVGTNQLALDAEKSCLSAHVKLNLTGYQNTPIPQLNLPITLTKASRVLLWMDGIAHTDQAAPENQDVDYLLTVDGIPKGGVIEVDTNYWKQLTSIRLVNLTSGPHTIGMSVVATKSASLWIWGEPNGSEACVSYLVLGS